MAPSPPLPLTSDDLLRTRAPLERATQLPGAAFTDPAVLEWELAQLFRGGWICAGHVDQVRERGRLPDGRRRRARACSWSPTTTASRARSPTPAATAARACSTRPRAACARLQCPYHAWSYGFDGALRSAPFTEGLEDFDARCYGLHAGAPGGRRGHRAARPLRRGAAAARSTSATCARTSPATGCGELRRARADRLRGRRQLEGDRRELQRVPALPGRAPRAQPALALPVGRDDRRRRRVVRRLDDAAPRASTTMAADGGARAAADRRADRADQRSVLYFLLFPNTLVSLHPDYVMLHTLWPRAPGSHARWSASGSSSPRRWPPTASTPPTPSSSGTRSTARTGDVCELTQRGMGSRGVHPGPLHDAGGRRARVRRDGGRPLPRGAARPRERSTGDGGRVRATTRSSSAAATTASPPAAYLARAGLRVCVLERRDVARRRVRDRGAVARPARVARLLRRLDAAAEGRRRPASCATSATTRSRSTRRSPRSPPTARPILFHNDTAARRRRRSRRVSPHDAAAMPGVRGAAGARRGRPAAADAAPAAGGRLAPPGRPARAAARGRPRRRACAAARSARALPGADDVGRRPARRLVRGRRAQGRLRLDRRRRRVGRPAHARHRLQPAPPRARRARGRLRRVGARARRDGRDLRGDRGQRPRRRRRRSAPRRRSRRSTSPAGA